MSRKSTNFSSPLPTLKVLFSGFYFYHLILLSFGGRVFEKKKKDSLTYEKITKNFCYI
ncbi:hypothetical protein NTPn34_02875 [Streptococcus pneumoniae]|nr:hypothetical protein SPAR47_1018 [Streptococcus pneumoniae GA17484]KXW26887.1 hypothetical protein NTPn34_02875 [Streptococcus pneumoniae]ODO41870.1 hypothetical protein A5N02_02855 [Streptococcus pneumoniae]ODO44267.1 hypothetical protein A5N47_02455 [Streptococcus pneumoniae]ODO45181.1 hypothetical protein A5M97_04085 [Streptococcus pneumoniae]